MLRSHSVSTIVDLPVNPSSPGQAITAQTFLGDISESLAVSAYNGTSWVPERRAATTREEYANELVAIHVQLSKHAETPEKLAVLAAEFSRFRLGYASRYRAYLLSRSRVVSAFIAGPSNFPVRRMEKRGNIAHRRLDEFLEFKRHAVEAIIRTLHPEWRPIMSGDADAVERLEEKVHAAEALQVRMKAANAVIRKQFKAGPEAQVLGLVAIGFTELQARKLLVPDFVQRIGFADYELTNNSANLRRMKKRLEQIRSAKATEPASFEGALARLDDCPAENRVRLTYSGKPSADVREALKRSGFRWAPSLGVWQAYRNYQSLSSARRFAGVEEAA